MANTYKVLGQSAPAATTATTVYTCPAATQTIVSVIVICNRSTATTFRVGVDVNGAGDSNSDYLAYDMPIGANETIEIGKGVTLDASDLIRVYAGSANLTFSVFGEEIA